MSRNIEVQNLLRRVYTTLANCGDGDLVTISKKELDMKDKTIELLRAEVLSLRKKNQPNRVETNEDYQRVTIARNLN